MIHSFFTVYPWDLLDVGVDEVLDRLHGEIGASGVSVPVAIPPLTTMRVNDVEPRVFRTRGGLLFRPDDGGYDSTRCKPIVSGWPKGRDVLERIASACSARGMAFRVVVSAGQTGRLAQRHPDMACKNAYGIGSTNGICLSNPDVQTYLCALVSDLTAHHKPGGVVIRDFASVWTEGETAELVNELPVGDAEMALLTLCFCESCHQGATAAGVEAGGAQRCVVDLLQRSFDRGRPWDGGLGSILEENAALLEFLQWKGEALSALLARMMDSCATELLLDRGLIGRDKCKSLGVDLSVPAGVMTRLDDRVGLAGCIAHGARTNELRLPACFALRPRGPELVAIVSDAGTRGYAGVDFDHWALLPDAALTSIKQAIRFVRRASDG